MATMAHGELHLRVVTPDRTVIDRKVKAVSFMGVDGSYGILPNHAPLITATADASVVKVTGLDGKIEELIVSDGFVEMSANTLTLVCKAGESAHEIDLDRAKEAEARARKRIADAQAGAPEVDVLRAEAALRKALLRQSLGKRRGVSSSPLN